ncbi:MAG: hypothetical protein F2838_00275 [Actinobacteria bacterium]|nr:hypothetical protein [Actinomycetota bacterium]
MEVTMQSRNPVLRRATETATGRPASSGGAGFAYDEGRAAYSQATGAAAVASTVDAVPSIYDTAGPDTGRLTIDDVVVKTAITFVAVLIGAVIGWSTAVSMPWLWIASMFVGLGLGLANSFMKKVKPPLVLAYALVEGVFLGGISYAYNQMAIANNYYGIVQQAVLGTLVAFGVMLFLYKTGIVKVNGRFKAVMMAALISYLLIGVVSFVAAMFGVGSGWGFYGVGGIGILLCVAGVGLASFTLMLDFEAISQAVQQGAPERESWRLAFGLLVTLIWLYLELLRLISIISGRD